MQLKIKPAVLSNIHKLHIEVNGPGTAMCKRGEVPRTDGQGKIFRASEPALRECYEIQSSHCYMAASH